jgi:hypothetical protein
LERLLSSQVGDKGANLEASSNLRVLRSARKEATNMIASEVPRMREHLLGPVVGKVFINIVGNL